MMDEKGTQIAVDEMIAELENMKTVVTGEITNYPPPIPACDAQFNYLLEQRDQLANEISRLRDVSQEGMTVAECISILDELASKPYSIPTEMAQRIRSHLT